MLPAIVAGRCGNRRFDSLYSHGFARIAAAVPHLKPADPEFNTDRTLALARQASDDRAAVVVFPELGISAYAIDDLLHQQALQDGVLIGLERIVAASADLFSVLVVGRAAARRGRAVQLRRS